MNERIRELAEQAGYRPLPGFDFANSLEEIYLKKFAELIVRECAGLCSMTASGRDAEAIEEAILKHFGVES
jgi:hypothetical protein